MIKTTCLFVLLIVIAEFCLFAIAGSESDVFISTSEWSPASNSGSETSESSELEKPGFRDEPRITSSKLQETMRLLEPYFQSDATLWGQFSEVASHEVAYHVEKARCIGFILDCMKQTGRAKFEKCKADALSMARKLATLLRELHNTADLAGFLIPMYASKIGEITGRMREFRMQLLHESEYLASILAMMQRFENEKVRYLMLTQLILAVAKDLIIYASVVLRAKPVADALCRDYEDSFASLFCELYELILESRTATKNLHSQIQNFVLAKPDGRDAARVRAIALNDEVLRMVSDMQSLTNTVMQNMHHQNHPISLTQGYAFDSSELETILKSLSKDFNEMKTDMQESRKRLEKHRGNSRNTESRLNRIRIDEEKRRQAIIDAEIASQRAEQRKEEEEAKARREAEESAKREIERIEETRRRFEKERECEARRAQRQAKRAEKQKKCLPKSMRRENS